MMPHDPYLADAAGNLMRLDVLLNPNQPRDEKKLYLGYLQYANKKLLSFIGRLQKVSVRPTVILLMSDHGFRRAESPQVYHFSNFNAVYFPDGDYNLLYTGFSNVNQLRLLLQKQFNCNLPLLKDSSIYLDPEMK
jgi:hypothetical protein